MAKPGVSVSMRLALLLLLSALVAVPATAQVAKQGNDVLSSMAFVHDKLQQSQPFEPFDTAQSLVVPTLQNGWAAFLIGANSSWKATVDHRSGLVAFAEGGNIAWVPGRGNNLTNANLSTVLAGRTKPDLSVLDTIARNYMKNVASMLGVDPATLVLNQGRSGQPAGHVWFVDYDVVLNGMTVEGARVVFRVNNGNLIQFGSENIPVVGTVVPDSKLSQSQALAAASKFIGGFTVADTFRDNGSLHLLPANVANNGFAEGFKFGQGRGLVKVWQFVFHRDGVMGTWRVRIDATTGEVLEFSDVNEYAAAQVSGGTYLNSPTTGSEVVRPTPFANVSSGGFSNSGGVYNFTSGTVTSTLSGQFVKITDTCGAISQGSDASGNIAFGTSTGTDCTTPGHGGAGNTHASREQFYQVNRIKEVVKGWLPANTWLNQVLTVNVNLNQTCNAYWNGTTLNFFKSGGGCANTGEIAGVSLHEFGHGIDQNDGTGTAPDGATGESYGDTTALIALHNSCLGAGFLGGNCSGYGDACTSCTGVRDADFAKHASGTAATALNFIKVHCPAGSGGTGPCGKEVHCESYVPTETIWDFANRDLPGAGTGPAWTTLDRLWYLSRNTATSAFTCNHTTFASDGCGTGSLWKTMRAVDDDDGNLANGTPHGGALFAAFNRHAIACTTDAGASTTFSGCTPPATPTLSITGGSNSASLSWTTSGSAVYDVFRNETGCNAGFTKISSGSSATTLSDTVLSNGLTYFYQVTAFPSGNEACASAPSTCISVTPSPIACTPPAAPTGVTATATGQSTATVSWTASSGATSYKIFRSTTSGGPYTQVGTSTTTSFADSGLTCNTTYFYVVTASNGTCDSGNSAQASTTTSVCTCTPPAAPTGLASSGTTQTGTTVSWTASSGATSYKILRSTTSGGPYTQVGTSTTTSFTDTGLTCNTSYFYVVVASNGSCDSGNSAQLTVTTSACGGGCTVQNLYNHTFEGASGLDGWSTGVFVSGGSAASWRGVQACSPAHSGSNIFRYGGTTCTSNYTNNNFTFAQPNGTAGIAVPAGATGTTLTFWHRRGFESGFDGGTLTVSVDGTNYFFVPATAITAGTTYNGTISAICPPAGAAGAAVFTGTASTMTSTTVNLDAACNAATGLTTGCAGRSVRIGFTTITDCSTTGTGWFLDDVSVTACF
ncbi:MAG TPA: fibronectin type III domain-containing protein [Thermoanaerobaculia bacterium]|nr:fibronectin type III domain-containing protein [Thermoanaerobaculia bacterium]